MSKEEDQQDGIDTLLSDAGDYIETRTRLWKLKVIENLSDVSGELVSGLALIGIALVVILILSTGLALLIGYWTGQRFYGFFIVGGVILMAGLICYGNRDRWLKKPFSNMLIRKILK